MPKIKNYAYFCQERAKLGKECDARIKAIIADQGYKKGSSSPEYRAAIKDWLDAIDRLMAEIEYWL